MDARIDVVTLGVDDLERALAFYRDGLGLKTQGIVGTQWVGDETTPAGAVVMFDMRGGLKLALYPRPELAKDAAVASGPPQSAGPAASAGPPQTASAGPPQTASAGPPQTGSAEPPRTAEFSIGQIVSSRQEVDDVLARAQAAGATVTDQAHERPWGIYSGYFRDPDGHLWEIIWSPRESGAE